MKDLKAARKEMNGVLGFFSLCKLLLVLSSLFLGSLLYAILFFIFGNSATRVLSELSSYGTLPGLLLELAVFIFCVFVPICLYFFLSGKKYSDTVPQQKPEFLQICYGVGATVVLGNVSASVGNIALYILFSFFGMQDKYYAMLESTTEYPTNFWLVPLFFILLAVFPAFFEEIMIRGIGLSVAKKYGTLFALFFSGFFFSFMHGTWVQLIFAFVVGIVLAYFTLRFKTIWIAIISHFIFNFNSVVQSLILQNGGRFSSVLSNAWAILYFTLMVGLAVAGVIIYGVKKPDVPKPKYTAGERMKILFSSPFLYVFLCLEAVQLIYLLILY